MVGGQRTIAYQGQILELQAHWERWQPANVRQARVGRSNSPQAAGMAP